MFNILFKLLPDGATYGELLKELWKTYIILWRSYSAGPWSNTDLCDDIR